MHKKDFSPWLVQNGVRLELADIPTAPSDEGAASSAEYTSKIEHLTDKLNKLQSLLHASGSRGVLLVLQGMDTAGKDGAIRHIFSHVSPLGVRAEAFGAPSEEEKKHDFLWRVHQKIPRRGELVVFNRSHYEDVIVTRVRDWIKKSDWEKRYQHIQNFESMLHDEGITVIKCYLHISKQEQKKRLQARMDDPAKQWKLQASDFEDRKQWGEFIEAYQDALIATSTEHAPWYIVPADSKPYRDLFVAELLVQTLDKLKLSLPEPSFDLKHIKLV